MDSSTPTGDDHADPESAALLEAGARNGIAPYLLLVTLSIHSLIAGITLGISTAAGATVLLIAILAHKGAAGFALGSTFREADIPPRTRIPALLVFVGSTPLGVVLGGVAIDLFGGGGGAAAKKKAAQTSPKKGGPSKAAGKAKLNGNTKHGAVDA